MGTGEAPRVTRSCQGARCCLPLQGIALPQQGQAWRPGCRHGRVARSTARCGSTLTPVRSFVRWSGRGRKGGARVARAVSVFDAEKGRRGGLDELAEAAKCQRSAKETAGWASEKEIA